MEEGKVNVWQATVLANQPRASGIFELVLSCAFVQAFGLGQFVCVEPLDPQSVMSRPFSIYARNLANGTISLLIKVVGKNTKLLSQLVPGQQIRAWGPLGRATKTAALLDYQKVWLVGGGVGIAALCRWQK
jgi:dihydroorotate dehydrogenase electron transfer subunit